ncbi:UDP:flavonoid glycosyltransferase YjiC (YdhE family) [Sphingomonas sp. UYAg733]
MQTDRDGKTMPMRRIVLTTVGTLGDLHPFIAIALALRSRGFSPVLAVPEDQVEKCVQAGLDAVGVRPGFDSIARHMALSHDAAVRRIMGNQRVMLEQVPAARTFGQRDRARSCGGRR